jgi:hypothetical protein
MKEPMIGRFRVVPILALLLAISGVYYWFFVPSPVTDAYNLRGYGFKGSVKSYEYLAITEVEDKFGEWVFEEEDAKLQYRIRFDRDGNLQEIESYNYDTGDLKETEANFKYENGIMVESTVYDAEDSLLNVLKREVFEDEGYEIAGFNEKFGKGSTLYTAAIYDKDGSLDRHKREVVKDSRVIAIVYSDASDKVYYRKKNEVSEERLITKSIVTYVEDSHTTTYEFEPVKFDEEGNWIQSLVRIKSDDGKEIDISPVMTLRKIEYY